MLTLATCLDETQAVPKPTEKGRITLPPAPSVTGFLHAGVRLCGFELRRKLGAGGMGEVWLGHDGTLDRNVAIKVLPPQFARDENRLARFLREAKAAARLDHPNVATVYQAGVDNGMPFIAMQYIDGGSLENASRPGRPMPWRDATRLIKEAAAGLAAAHALGLVHRDIKPSNLMRTKSGVTKVVDFGLARTIEGATELTQDGIVMGTPAYMAPELWSDHEADQRSDLYALSCTYFFLLTGRSPFNGSTFAALAEQHRAQPLPDPRPFSAGIPAAVCRILARGAAKDPKQRYQTADEMVADLTAVLSAANRPVHVEAAAQTTTALSPPAVAKLPATRRWSSGTLWSTVIGALAGLAVLAMLFGLPSPRRNTTNPELVSPSELKVQPVVLTEPGSPKPAVAATSTSTEKDDLAAAAHAVLKQHCYQCHGLADVNAGLHVLKPEVLLDPKEGFVVPGNLEKSRIWQQVSIEQAMPPAPLSPPKDSERDVLKRWILAGAPAFAADSQRRFRSQKDELTTIVRHLESVSPDNRKFQRYFTLANLHNNSFASRLGNNNTNVDVSDLRLARAALSKLINSLSKSPRIVLPRALDADETLFHVDLRDYDWTPEQWQDVLKVYPHGLKLNEVRDAELRKLADDAYRLAATEVPCVRADWFVATASRPPLYEKLLKLPPTVQELENQLKVPSEQNFLDNKLVRAGFTKSGVSQNNRLVERHVTKEGAYWKSYDFVSSKGEKDLFKRPLGPAFDKNSFKDESFRADGGEMIFSLPNGLQAYFLADSTGKHLAAGPIAVVRDLQETAGTTEVVNGISCMGCHMHGMIGFRDNIRNGLGLLRKPALEKVESLFPPSAQMDERLKEDENRFLAALDKAVGPFLRIGRDASKGIREFREPVSVVAKLYRRNLEIDDVTAELGFGLAEQLSTVIKSNSRLKGFGLSTLTNGDSITRDNWDSGAEKSLLQEVSEELGLGLAVRIADNTATKTVSEPAADKKADTAAPKANASNVANSEAKPAEESARKARPQDSPPQAAPQDLPPGEKVGSVEKPKPNEKPKSTYIPQMPITTSEPPAFVEVILSNGRDKRIKLVITDESTGKDTELEIGGRGSRPVTLNEASLYNVQAFLDVPSPVYIMGRPPQANFQHMGWFRIYPKKSAGTVIDVDNMCRAFESSRGSTPGVPNNSRRPH